MRSVADCFNIYKDNVRLAKKTITNYSFYITKFISYLSVKMHTNPNEIYFDKIYLLKDSTGKSLRHLPIDGAIIDDYFHSLISNGKGYIVLKDNYKSLMSLFKFIEKNYVLENPLKNAEFQLNDFLPEKKFPKALTRGNIIKFFNSVITHSDDLITEVLLFTVLFSTGCRISEILNLKCQDIDFANNTFHLVKTKTNHQRLVLLRPGMGNEIEKYIRNRNKDFADYLFVKDNGKRITSKDVNDLLKKYLQLAKLPIITAHGTRHTFANLMADQGTPIDLIRQLLGHESLSATKIYINPHYIRNKNFHMPENEIVINYLKNKI